MNCMGRRNRETVLNGWCNSQVVSITPTIQIIANLTADCIVFFDYFLICGHLYTTFLFVAGNI